MIDTLHPQYPTRGHNRTSPELPWTMTEGPGERSLSHRRWPRIPATASSGSSDPYAVKAAYTFFDRDEATSNACSKGTGNW